MSNDPKRDFVNDLTDALVALNNAKPTLPAPAEIAATVKTKLDAHLSDIGKMEAIEGMTWQIADFSHGIPTTRQYPSPLEDHFPDLLPQPASLTATELREAMDKRRRFELANTLRGESFIDQEKLRRWADAGDPEPYSDAWYEAKTKRARREAEEIRCAEIMNAGFLTEAQATGSEAWASLTKKTIQSAKIFDGAVAISRADAIHAVKTAEPLPYAFCTDAMALDRAKQLGMNVADDEK